MYKEISPTRFFFRSPLSGAENQGKIKERSSYYPQEPNKRPQTKREKVQSCLSHNALTILTVAGVIGGVILGIILRNSQEKWTPREIMYINYFGDLFLRMLKSLILPLIISSLVSAIGSLDLSLSGKIGMRAISYYMVTTICAVILGQWSLIHLFAYYVYVYCIVYTVIFRQMRNFIYILKVNNDTRNNFSLTRKWLIISCNFFNINFVSRSFENEFKTTKVAENYFILSCCNNCI